uniref:F-box domain-containing protein n=1 Tax=Romanomermis culicivorax TaxID=13658 RepID=A0A915KFM7_ROMCU
MTNSLPLELLFHILTYIPWYERIRTCEFMCKKWRNVCHVCKFPPSSRVAVDIGHHTANFKINKRVMSKRNLIPEINDRRSYETVIQLYFLQLFIGIYGEQLRL